MPERVSVPLPALVNAVPVPLMTPATEDAPSTLIVTRPPPVARLPIVAPPPPVVVMFNVPPAVVIVLPVFAMTKPPAPAVKDTDLGLVCFKFKLPSVVRLLMVMLLVAAREMLVVATMPSSSDS